jgi:hypothetical protein
MADSTVGGYRSVTLLASTTALVTAGATSTVTGLDYCESAMFWLNVTAAGTTANDKLDVWLQKTWDGGTTWTDFARFTQVLGNGGAVSYLAEWSSKPTPETEQGAPSDAAIAAGVVQGGTLGPQIRVKYVVTETNTATFTFNIKALLAGGRQF